MRARPRAAIGRADEGVTGDFKRASEATDAFAKVVVITIALQGASTTKNGALERAPLGKWSPLYQSNGCLCRCCFVIGIAQNVAAAPDGLDVVLTTGCCLQFFPQLTDEDVDNFELRFVHAAVKVI